MDRQIADLVRAKEILLATWELPTKPKVEKPARKPRVKAAPAENTVQ